MHTQIKVESATSELLSLLKKASINIESNDGAMKEGVMRKELDNGSVCFSIDFALVCLGVRSTFEGENIKLIDEAIAENKANLAINVKSYQKAKNDHSKALFNLREQAFVKACKMRDDLVTKGTPIDKADIQSDEWFNQTIVSSNAEIKNLELNTKDLYIKSTPGLPDGILLGQNIKDINVRMAY